MFRTFFVVLKCTIQGGPKVDVLLIAFLYLWLKFWEGIDKYWIVSVRKLFYFQHWLKCIAVCFITPIAARFLHLCACFTCSSVHVSTLHPLLAHHHLCFSFVDVNCVLFAVLSVFFLCACASFLLLCLLPLVCNLMCSLVILHVAFLLLLLSFL